MPKRLLMLTAEYVWHFVQRLTTIERQLVAAVWRAAFTSTCCLATTDGWVLRSRQRVACSLRHSAQDHLAPLKKQPVGFDAQLAFGRMRYCPRGWGTFYWENVRGMFRGWILCEEMSKGFFAGKFSGG